MAAPAKHSAETDPRFPSGPWTGFFLQKLLPGRHLMEMHLQFADGAISGSGRDRVGAFVIDGFYDLKDGSCRWHKQYVGLHSVFYRGFNEGKGIWGTWEIPTEPPHNRTGGFHIWPEGMADPTQPHLSEEVEEPIVVEETTEFEAPVKLPMGTQT
jgi:hypothetical protein